MNINELVEALRREGARLKVVDNKLSAKLPKNFSPQLKAALIKHKEDVKAYIAGLMSLKVDESKVIRHQSRESAELSFAQQRLWFIDRLQSSSSEYNMPVAYEVAGELDLKVVSRVMTEIIERHQVLRSVYLETEQGARQYIRSCGDFNLQQHDLTNLSGEKQTQAFKQLMVEDANNSFDLSKDLMVRASYILLDKGEKTAGRECRAVLLFNMHHIASDGWSMAVLTREFFSLYLAFTQGNPSPLAPLEIQYADYAHWQRKWLQGEALEAQLNYWDRQLQDLPPVHGLRLDNPRPEIKQYQGQEVLGQLSPRVSADLLTLAKHFQLTPFMLAHAALALVLSRHSNSRDIVIGTAVANRLQAELEPLIGFFINTLVLRLDTGHQELADYLAHVRQVHQEAQSHQDVPFEQLVERLNIVRDPAFTPLFQVMLTTNSDFSQNAGQADVSQGVAGVNLSRMSTGTITAKFDLDINIDLKQDGGQIRWTYDKVLFTRQHIEQLNGHLTRLLEGLSTCLVDIGQSDIPLAKLPQLSDDELNYLCHTLNASDVDVPHQGCIHELFEHQALLHPDNIALEFADRRLSYRELNEKANRLAHYLLEQHIKPDTLVGVSLPRSLDMLVALLAILKAGGAYVPLDPDYPQARLQHMLTDSRLQLLLTHEALEEKFLSFGVTCLALDNLTLNGYPVDNPKTAGLTACNLAYVIYTSGSTGMPKGVMVEHKGIVNLASIQARQYQVNENSRFLQFASISFDAAVWEWIGALCHGGILYICSEEQKLSPDLLGDYLEQKAISHALLPPVLLPHLDAGRNYAFTALFTGGEACREQQAWRWAQRFPFYNAYGPSESSVITHIGKVTANKALAIGRVIDNVTAYVLDDQGELLPAGVEGELCVGGLGLARGYLYREALTAEKFIDNPFGDGRLYRTGDKVRYLADGQLEFIGRIDDQVKIRGFRIELGEIEHQLNRLEAVDSALVQVKEPPQGDKLIVAYVKPCPGHEAETETIRQALSRTLPAHMVPGVFVSIEQWPQTANGKVDKKALPEPDMELSVADYLAPITKTEKALVQIWADLLKLDSETISANASFFELGGHSLLSVRVVSEIRRCLAVELPVKAVFEASSLQTLARAVDTAAGNVLRPEITALKSSGQGISLSFAQQRLWFIDRLQSGSPEYNMPAAFLVVGRLDIAAANEVFTQIIKRHEILRTLYRENETGALQVVTQSFTFALTQHDLSALAAQEQEAQLQRLLDRDAKTPFDLSEDLMLRACVIDLGDNDNGPRHVLAFNMHHIASDGWSFQVLTREFCQLYQARVQGLSGEPEPLAIQYGDYAHWQRQWLQGSVLETQLAYWQQQLLELPQVHSLPLDQPRPDSKQYAGAQVRGALPAQTAVALQRLAHVFELTPFMLMHAALALVLSRHSNSRDIVVGTPVANRLQAELEPLIGFFVNTLVLRLNTDHDRLGDYLAQVRQVHLDAQSHQDVPFEQLVERLNIPRSQAFTPLFQVMLTTNSDFSLAQDKPGTALELPGLTLTPLSSQAVTAKFDLDIHITIDEQGVSTCWTYDKALFSQQHIAQLDDHFCRLLEGIAVCAGEPEVGTLLLKDLPLLSDGEVNHLLENLSRVNRQGRDYDRQACIHELFQRQAAEHPDSLALIYQGQSLSYRQLNEKANQLAHYLVEEQRVKPDTLVGICLDRSLEMVIAILGILKAGGAYVPLDPGYPQDRIDYILADAGLGLVLTRHKLLTALDFKACVPVNLDQIQAGDSSGSCFSRYPTTDIDSSPLGLNSCHLAYVIYTSGSTGQPKGVMISHGNASALAAEMATWPVCNRQQAWGWFASYVFDASVQGLLRLMCGQPLVILPDEVKKDPDRLVQVLQTQQIGVLDCTPTMVAMWFDAGIERTLPNLVIGGEVISTGLWQQLVGWKQQQDTLAVNVYGPTETCVNSTCAEIKGQTVTIGLPLGHVTSYIMDKDMKPVPENGVGELYLGGDGLARGYLNKPGLSAECFVENPYFDSDKSKSSARLYKTGDLVRYLPSGELDFIGRLDDQVKIRGFRIELGEIESRINLLDGVDSALVITKALADGTLDLLAYVKSAVSRDINGEDERRLLDQDFIAGLRLALARTLPGYMVPTGFMLIEEWPMTVNGKLDKRALPQFEAAWLQADHQAPKTDTEKALVQIWAELLKIPADKISTRANFFELGGHSLLTVRLAGAIRKTLNFDIQIKHVFELSSIEQLSSFIDNIDDTVTDSAPLALSEQRPGNTDIYCIPGVAGLAQSFAEIARQLPVELFNIKAFNHQGLFDGAQAFTSIAQNADAFLSEILKQDSRDYVLLGHSYGGALALEICRRAQALGHRVQLILLDTYFEQSGLKVLEQPKSEVIAGDFPPGIITGSDQAFADNLAQLSRLQGHLFSGYRPESLSDVRPLILFARDSYYDLDHYLSRLSKIFPGGFEHDMVTGDHVSMLTAAGSGQVALRLKEKWLAGES